MKHTVSGPLGSPRPVVSRASGWFFRLVEEGASRDAHFVTVRVGRFLTVWPCRTLVYIPASATLVQSPVAFALLAHIPTSRVPLGCGRAPAQGGDPFTLPGSGHLDLGLARPLVRSRLPSSLGGPRSRSCALECVTRAGRAQPEACALGRVAWSAEMSEDQVCTVFTGNADRLSRLRSCRGGVVCGLYELVVHGPRWASLSATAPLEAHRSCPCRVAVGIPVCGAALGEPLAAHQPRPPCSRAPLSSPPGRARWAGAEHESALPAFVFSMPSRIGFWVVASVALNNDPSTLKDRQAARHYTDCCLGPGRSDARRLNASGAVAALPASSPGWGGCARERPPPRKS